MADKTTIEWTDATWNPVTGCTKISAGCDNCYASRFSERFRGVAGHPFENGFDLSLRPERLFQPVDWKRPRMIFVKFDGRSLSQRSAERLHLEGVHYNGKNQLAYISSADKTQFFDAEIYQ